MQRRDPHIDGITREPDKETVQGDPKRGPLDGSTSGTIGGGGAESGGPTRRPKGPDMPAVDPDNAASGRRAPDALDGAADRDPLKTGPTDVSNARDPTEEQD